MKKNKFKIGDVARELGIKKSIIRQWELDFNLKTSENQHYYSSEDLTVLKTIKDLLRTQGMSIDDAKKQLQQTFPAKKYVDVPQPQPEEAPKQKPEKQASVIPAIEQQATSVEIPREPKKEMLIIPKKENEAMSTAPIKSKPAENVEKKQASEPKIDHSKDVRSQLSSLKEKLLKFKKLLD